MLDVSKTRALCEEMRRRHPEWWGECASRGTGWMDRQEIELWLVVKWVSQVTGHSEGIVRRAMFEGSLPLRPFRGWDNSFWVDGDAFRRCRGDFERGIYGYPS